MVEFPWEDNLLERKVESDLKDLPKTLVAFANSVKPDHTAVILIGEKDDGTIQGVTDADNIQKRIRKECDKIYPPILWRSEVYEKEDKYCVRIEIEYDGETPHFGGAAWVRKGSETIKATDETFQRLIDLRSGTVYELARWLDKEVTIHGDSTSISEIRASRDTITGVAGAFRTHRWKATDFAKIVFVNNHWVTFQKSENGQRISEPLKKLTLSYDDKNGRLKVIIAY